jgi:hypothetical protein
VMITDKNAVVRTRFDHIFICRLHILACMPLIWHIHPRLHSDHPPSDHHHLAAR